MLILCAGRQTRTRRGEFLPFPGIRGRTRAIPYTGFEPPGADPWQKQYRSPAPDSAAEAGSPDQDGWVAALRASPPGPILIGPAPPAEPVYTSALAAIGAARELARGVVAVDVAGVWDRIDFDDSLVRVEIWRAGEEAFLWERLERTRGRVRQGIALAVLPGWTAESDYLEAFLPRAREAGVDFVAPFGVEGEGQGRAAIHADYSRENPAGADAFFNLLFHADWEARTHEGILRLREAAAKAGVATRVPRPPGAGEFRSNARVIEALESEAEDSPEPFASELFRAARRIEDVNRNIEELVLRGNRRLLFPAGSRAGEVAERVLCGEAVR